MRIRVGMRDHPQPALPAPPARGLENGLCRGSPGREIGEQRAQGGSARLRAADVVGPRFIVAVETGDQAVPVGQAKERPRSHCPDIHPTAPGTVGGVPGFEHPAHLLFASRSEMDLGDCERSSITLPGLVEDGPVP